MQNSKKPTIGYGPPKKTNVLANIALGLIAILIVVAIIALVKDKNKSSQNNKNQVSADKTTHEVNTGQTLHTRYFDIIIDKVLISENVSDSSGPVNLPKENNSQYLLMEITLKNTDTESKMMPEGQLHIESSSGEIFYKHPETILINGWGILMENIPPGSTRKTKLVYKIPSGIKASIYYYPDMSYSNDRILIKI